MKIGFICTGNTCRSPMAESYFRHITKNYQVEVFSAGLGAGYGWRAADEARRIMEKNQIEMTEHVSQPLTREMVLSADMLIAMTDMHREKIISRWPEAKNKVYLLLEFDKNHHTDLDVFDPVGCPLEIYEKCFELMKNALEHLGELVCKKLS